MALAASRTKMPLLQSRGARCVERRAHLIAQSGRQQEMRICTGKVCKKQGSQQVLKFARDLGIDELDVQECGCLGNCGNGPNMVLLPEGLQLRHVATPADVADVITWQCSIEVPHALIKATELRLAGNMLVMGGDLGGAVQRYTEALALDPPRGRHLLHSNLSAAHLQQGNKEAALEHAESAVALAPRGFHMAHIRLIDALYALGRFGDAAAAAAEAVRRDAAFAALPEYKVIGQALKKQGVAAA